MTGLSGGRLVVRGVAGALLGVMALALSGCGGSGGGHPDRPVVTAADGTSVDACVDGTCEISVPAPETVRFAAPGGVATLSVTKVAKNAIEYTLLAADGSKSTSGVSGKGYGCTEVMLKGSMNGDCGPMRAPDGDPGATVMQLVSGSDGTATLRVHPS